MMKKFNPEEISSQNILKSSVQKNIRAQVLEKFPRLDHVIDDILPKKATATLVKCQNHLQIVIYNSRVIFFQQRDGPWIPTLRLLHEYPSMMPKMQVDKGAIKFVLRGSNIMCQGLTSPGGRMEDVPSGAVVQIVAEGKMYPCAIGVTTMSTEEIRQVNKGPCIEIKTYLNDGIWNFVPE